MWTVNFQIFNLDLEKAEDQRLNCQHPLDHRARVLKKKHLLLLFWLCQSLWLCESQQTVENASRDGNTRPPYLPPEKSMQVKKKQLEPDTEQWTGSKLGKEYVKAVYCHPAYLTSVQSTSCEMPSWMKHKLESSLPGEILITSDMQMIPPLWQKVKRN